MVHSAHLDHLGVGPVPQRRLDLQRRARQRHRRGQRAGNQPALREVWQRSRSAPSVRAGDGRGNGPARLGVFSLTPTVLPGRAGGRYQHRYAHASLRRC
ncbi:MAG: hypothetical protein WKG07_35055 [Hymenobacter sp.]